MKKFLVVFSMIWVTLLLLLSCGGNTSNEDIVSIDFWTTQTQAERLKVIETITDTFEALHPNIAINVVPVDENDLVTKIEVIVQGNGKLPDIAELSSGPAVSFGTAQLIDTDAVSEVVNTLEKERFFDGALALVSSATNDNVYYGVPYHGWIQGIWYRKDWFKRDGIAPPNTWESILNAAKFYYKPKENQYGIVVGTKAEVYAEQVYTPIALSNNARVANANGEIIFNSPNSKQALEYYAQLAKYGPPGPQTWRARDYYLQGNMAMFFYSTYILDDLAIQSAAENSLTGDNFEGLSGAEFNPDLAKNTGFEPIITHKDSASYGTLVTMSLFKNTDEMRAKAARMFLEFLLEKDSYISFLHMAPGGMLPMRKGIADTDEFLNDPKGIYALYGAEAVLDIVRGFEGIKTFNIIDGTQIEVVNTIFSKQVIPQMIYAVTQENKDIESALAEAEKIMKTFAEK